MVLQPPQLIRNSCYGDGRAWQSLDKAAQRKLSFSKHVSSFPTLFAGPIHAAAVELCSDCQERQDVLVLLRDVSGQEDHGVMHTTKHLFDISELMETGLLLKT